MTTMIAHARTALAALQLIGVDAETLAFARDEMRSALAAANRARNSAERAACLRTLSRIRAAQRRGETDAAQS